MKKLVFLIFLLSQNLIEAQTISKKEAIEDLELLKKSIEDFNPALPHYHPEFASQSDQLIQTISEDAVSMLELYTSASTICAFANEGHFKVGNRNDAFNKGILNNEKGYLPIQVKIVSGQLWVYGDFSNEQLLKRGERIMTINGIQSNDILNRFLELTPSDGNIETYAYRKIEDKFSLLFYFHIEQSDAFTISLLDENQNERTITIQALVTSDQIGNIKKYYPKEDTPTAKTEGFYELKLESTYAYLKLPSFDFRRVNKYEVKSKKLYKAIFQELRDKRVGHLIIDLRDNTGGRNEFADDIVPYVLKDIPDHSFLKKTISWSGKTKTYKLPKPSELVFKGQIYVLVNGKTFSAGSTLARYLKEYGNAICIGTETGTRYEGFAAGSEHRVVLPNSKITIDIPRYHIRFPQSTKQQTINRGLLPDHEIELNFDVYTTKRDPYLEKAISLINSTPKR